KTLEEGTHTYDIFKEGTSKQKVGTQEFAEAVIKNLGKNPSTLKPVSYENKKVEKKPFVRTPIQTERKLVGVDVYLCSNEPLTAFVKHLKELHLPNCQLDMISNRGARVYPNGMPETFCVDQWRVRFLPKGAPCSQEWICALLTHLADEGCDIIKTENLYTFDGKPGYSSPKG
ncbi:MAG: NADP-dependent isocitrate dehydrogenase, partial [Chlamydiia bacterium]|nr:NADP-dependent isocitrate dehydrogenase [Chlamydiia bacterium]